MSSGEAMPVAVRPMAATLTTELPTDDTAWAFEIKWDGIRAVAFADDGRLRLTSRTQRDITAGYPEVQPLSGVFSGRQAVLDGELVSLDDEGRPSFQRLQARMNVTPEKLTMRLRRDVPVVFVAFDLLHLDGRGLMSAPYTERRGLLEDVLAPGPAWHVPGCVTAHGAEFLAAARDRGLEGVVAKRLASRYQPGRRSRDWLKIKNIRAQEFVIGGWLPGEGSFSGLLGALALGYHDAGGALRYAGRVGTGMSHHERRRLMALLAPLEIGETPFVGLQPTKGGCVFVRPEVVCEVAFSDWTDAGTLRQPVYRGTRDDKPATDVVRETP